MVKVIDAQKSRKSNILIEVNNLILIKILNSGGPTYRSATASVNA
jgi:hypothetical protein